MFDNSFNLQVVLIVTTLLFLVFHAPRVKILIWWRIQCSWSKVVKIESRWWWVGMRQHQSKLQCFAGRWVSGCTRLNELKKTWYSSLDQLTNVVSTALAAWVISPSGISTHRLSSSCFRSNIFLAGIKWDAQIYSLLHYIVHSNILAWTSCAGHSSNTQHI